MTKKRIVSDKMYIRQELMLKMDAIIALSFVFGVIAFMIALWNIKFPDYLGRYTPAVYLGYLMMSIVLMFCMFAGLSIVTARPYISLNEDEEERKNGKAQKE